MGRAPEEAQLDGGLTADPLAGANDPAGAVAAIEDVVLGFPRTPDEIALLLEQREGYLYRRGREIAGYSFVGVGGTGPIAALEPEDLPDILRHVETRAAAIGVERLELEVPSVNAVAVRHLLGRGFRIDPWINYLMANRPFGQFDRFIGFSPPLFL